MRIVLFHFLYRMGEEDCSYCLIVLKNVMVSRKHQETLRKHQEVFFIKVSKNKRRNYLTNFISVSIGNGHKTKLNSNFVLALSLSY